MAVVSATEPNNADVLSETDVNTSITDKNGLYVICEFDFVAENTRWKAESSDREKRKLKLSPGEDCARKLKLALVTDP